jgi:hypothetical protein
LHRYDFFHVQGLSMQNEITWFQWFARTRSCTTQNLHTSRRSALYRYSLIATQMQIRRVSAELLHSGKNERNLPYSRLKQWEAVKKTRRHEATRGEKNCMKSNSIPVGGGKYNFDTDTLRAANLCKPGTVYLFYIVSPLI